MMSVDQVLKAMTPQIHDSFKRAIEIGKWPNGDALTQQQKETCMAAIISYGESYLPEQERVGFIDRGPKAAAAMCDDEPVDTPLKWS